MVKIQDNLLYSMIEPCINGNKNDSDSTQIEKIGKLLLEKRQKNDSCSVNYETLKSLLFGFDEKINIESLTGLIFMMI